MINVYSEQAHQSKTKVLGSLHEHLGMQVNIVKESVQKLNESTKGRPKKLIVQMEAIHVGRTRNYTYYTKEGLSAGLESWTSPRPKPVLTHHNDMDGEPIGRIIKAEFHDVTQSGKPGLMFTVEITDPVAIEKVLDGRYQTVSIGANTDKVTCNICGTDRTTEWCEHYPGQEYDNQTAHFIIGTTMGREISYVNVPADEYAGNTSVSAVYEDDGEKTASSAEYVSTPEIFQIAEGIMQHVSNPEVNLLESMDEGQKRAFQALLQFEERSNDDMGNVVGTNTAEQENPEATPTGTPDPVVPTTVTENEKTPEPVAATTSVTEAALTEANKKVAEMQASIANLVMENQRLAGVITESNTENERLLSENASLVQAAHRTLAEKVVDLKRSLNKPDVVGVERESAVETHVTRTKESLDNTHADLVAEAQTWRPEPGSVTNPGQTEEGEQGDNAAKAPKMSISEAESLMRKMFKRQ